MMKPFRGCRNRKCKRNSISDRYDTKYRLGQMVTCNARLTHGNVIVPCEKYEAEVVGFSYREGFLRVRIPGQVRKMSIPIVNILTLP